MNIYAHPDWLAFVAGIIDEPANNLRRLVAADWLTEHGEEDRAEFIRLMCEVDTDAPHVGPVWDRLRELINARNYRFDWFMVKAGVHPGRRIGFARSIAWPNDSPYIGVSRGFPAVIHAPLAWVRGGACPTCDETNTACLNCKGTGHTPAYGYEVIRSHPITRVMVTDLQPRSLSEDWAAWFSEDLPADVWDSLTSPIPMDGPHAKWFRGSALADAALSAAIIADARGHGNG